MHTQEHEQSEMHSLLSAGQPQTGGEHRPGGGLVQPYSSWWTLHDHNHWTQMEPG